MPFHLVDTNDWINTDQTFRAVRDGSKIAYYTPSNDKEEIDYGSGGAAQTALDDFIATANSGLPINILNDPLEINHDAALEIEGTITALGGGTLDVTIQNSPLEIGGTLANTGTLTIDDIQSGTLTTTGTVTITNDPLNVDPVEEYDRDSFIRTNMIAIIDAVFANQDWLKAFAGAQATRGQDFKAALQQAVYDAAEAQADKWEAENP